MSEPTFWRVARAALVAVALLALVSFVALASRAGRPSGDAPLQRDPANLVLVDYIVTIIVTVIAVVLLIGLVVLLGWRPKQFDPPPSRWWRDLVMLTLFAGILWLFALQWEDWFQRARELRERADPATAGTTAPTDLQKKLRELEPERSARFRWEAAAAIIVLAGAGGAALVLLNRRRRLADRISVPEAEVAQALASAMDASIDDLQRESDPRRAVIRAYAQMEGVLANHGYPRRAYEAPFEFLARILRELRVRAAAALALTELFERARFSHHAIDLAMKEEAIEALVAVRDDLRAAVTTP
jgi:hypothetical protein